MINQTALKVFFANAILLCGAIALIVPNKADSQAQQRWEYIYLVANESVDVWPNENQINTLGDQGWELVATTQDKYNSTFILKRRK